MASAKPTLELANTARRDLLQQNEKKCQKLWQDQALFDADAPVHHPQIQSGNDPAQSHRSKKFFATFAYPYMNGVLHVGHSFTASKVEFSTSFAKMQGKRVLFPLGFHCTGMPIKTCADKLQKEVEMFGEQFDGYHEEADDAEALVNTAPTQSTTKEDITKFQSTKSKAQAKSVKAKYQFQIMLSMGIPMHDVHRFADPLHWIQHFPQQCEQDLKLFGARIDWRRSFVTTDANPYYDRFVKWQVNALKKLGKIQHGKRNTVYSPKDGQPCMDHDRKEGEGVGVQEYTTIKMQVKEWSPTAQGLVEGKLPPNSRVYFVAATLRPETMYGQTCCFIGPQMKYGVFKVSETDYYVLTKRAAWNMAFQGLFFNSDNLPKSKDELEQVCELSGASMVGTLVNAPLSKHTQGIRVLPMESVLPTKGTGVVTSVPSDSPDDFATVRELAKKAQYYGIEQEWAKLEIIEVIETAKYGKCIAGKLVETMKISSPKDAKLLAEAKDIAYKEGFYKGKMVVGDFLGESVEIAKPKVKAALVNNGDAFEYAEPDGHVLSRSGDECVVANILQWFINYGEDDPQWRDQVLDHLKGDMNTYGEETKNAFEKNLRWLNKWACARTYGLGSKLPWDDTFLVESLSDSTIYMAYYTICHFLHRDIFGKELGPFDIKASQMTDEVWDYIFCRQESMSTEAIETCGIPRHALEAMREEFRYWYPLDLRVSGKDLIPNHLTFFLYIHSALFPKEYWPQGIRVNGHLQLNGEKMAKSTGNFLTLRDAVEKFGADAARIALADAGDATDDANFDEKVANQAIMRLHNLREWCEKHVPAPSKELSVEALSIKESSDSNLDRMFLNEMNGLVLAAKKAYEDTNYKLVLKHVLYDFLGARDWYIQMVAATGQEMSASHVLKYIELQALLLTPIAPHWAEHIWLEVLAKKGSIRNVLYPSTEDTDPSLTARQDYIRALVSRIATDMDRREKRKGKGVPILDKAASKKLTIFYTVEYPQWQMNCFKLVEEHVGDNEALFRAIPGSDKKKSAPFVTELLRRINAGEFRDVVLAREPAFDERSFLLDAIPLLKKTLHFEVVDMVNTSVGTTTGYEENSDERGKITHGQGRWRDGLADGAKMAAPGHPSFECVNIQ